MSRMRLEIATLTHLDQLLEMMEDFNQHEKIVWSKARGAEPLSKMLTTPDLGLIGLILDEEKTAGYFMLSWGFDLEWNGRDAALTDLYLRPEARGRRLGKAVMEGIVQIAQDHGAGALHLQVREENVAALKLYRSVGFEQPPRLFMTKRLR